MTKKTSRRKATKPKTFFQRLRGLFKSFIKAVTPQSAEKRKAKLTREIKARGYAPSYEKRLLRAVQSGKAKSLQEARGHAPGEAQRRAERERENLGGLTSANIRSIKSFYSRYSQAGDREISLDSLVEYAQEAGYELFVEFRKTWDDLRRAYNRGERGIVSLDQLRATADNLLLPSVNILYYH